MEEERGLQGGGRGEIFCVGEEGAGERERGVVERVFFGREERSLLLTRRRENDAADVCECAERIIACNVFFGRQGARRVRVSAVELRTERWQKKHASLRMHNAAYKAGDKVGTHARNSKARHRVELIGARMKDEGLLVLGEEGRKLNREWPSWVVLWFDIFFEQWSRACVLLQNWMRAQHFKELLLGKSVVSHPRQHQRIPLAITLIAPAYSTALQGSTSSNANNATLRCEDVEV